MFDPSWVSGQYFIQVSKNFYMHPNFRCTQWVVLAPHFFPEVKEMWRLKWGYSEDGKEKCTFFCHSGNAVIVFPHLLIS